MELPMKCNAPVTNGCDVDGNLPSIRKGAARLIPMNSTPRYIVTPKAAAVPMQAEMFPRRPSHGFARTQSAIQHDVIEKAAMMRNVVLK